MNVSLQRYVAWRKHLRPKPAPKVEVEWREWSTRLSFGAFFLYLAGQVAAAIAAGKRLDESLDMLLVAVDGSDTVLQAECFLTRLLGMNVLDANMLRVILVFRHAVRHKLRQTAYHQAAFRPVVTERKTHGVSF